MSLSEYERRIVDSVERVGWFCVSVGAGSETPNFSYSVGFMDTLKCPEFIALGLDFDLTHAMLGAIFRQVRDRATEPRDVQRWSDILADCDCISRYVHPTQIRRELFNSAIWYSSYRGRNTDELKAFQLFWPGKQQGLFPWENDCDESVRACQPLLYLTRETGLA